MNITIVFYIIMILIDFGYLCITIKEFNNVMNNKYLMKLNSERERIKYSYKIIIFLITITLLILITELILFII